MGVIGLNVPFGVRTTTEVVMMIAASPGAVADSVKLPSASAVGVTSSVARVSPLVNDTLSMLMVGAGAPGVNANVVPATHPVPVMRIVPACQARNPTVEKLNRRYRLRRVDGSADAVPATPSARAVAMVAICNAARHRRIGLPPPKWAKRYESDRCLSIGRVV